MIKCRYKFKAGPRNYIIAWDDGDMTADTLKLLGKIVESCKEKLRAVEAGDAMIVELFHGMDGRMQDNIVEIMRLTQVN